VAVGQDVRIDATCSLAIRRRRSPYRANATVNTTNAQLGGEIEASAATDLPVAGRTFIFLLNYRPEC